MRHVVPFPSAPGVKRLPFAWIESQAWNFPTLWDAIDRNNKNKANMPDALLLTMFFEETGFCNIQQAGANGPAVGFGQIEVGNRDKYRFYQWLNDPDFPVSDEFIAKLRIEQLDAPTYKTKLSIREKVKTKMLGSKEFSVQIFCKYFEFLSTVDHKKQNGLVAAQIASHSEYKDRFNGGFHLLSAAMNKDWNGSESLALRAALINALNFARRRGPGEPLSNKDNPIPPDGKNAYTEFWDWILPPAWLDAQCGQTILKVAI
ncbi:MAG TPA: hypothetical protein VM120_07755 [Bryobacteraceae bacterium]|nr:hypothetical protein [Bryobacteraceae bacterium]